VPHILALSGTPLVNRPIELFPTLNILRPSKFPSRFAFGLKFCGARRGRWGWEYKGATNTKGLHELLTTTLMVRRRKADVLKELPAKVRQVVPVDIRDRSEYLRAENDFIAWLRKQDPNAAIRAKRAEAVTKAGYLLRLAAKLKCRAVYGWINEWLMDSDEKLVVFAVHRKMVEALHRNVFAKSVVVDGSVSGRDRQHAVDQFQNDRKTRVLIGNVTAAGVGLNLTAASTVAFAELPWQPGAVTQAEDRCHRIGQTGSVLCHYLVARYTIEEKRAAIIQKKQDVLSAVLDGGRVEGDLDVFDDFLETLK
jgi:SWI/SNF-related matrix-associated actin-dependent regulator of chromatin subfamily A-like protein 1